MDGSCIGRPARRPARGRAASRRHLEGRLREILRRRADSSRGDGDVEHQSSSPVRSALKSAMSSLRIGIAGAVACLALCAAAPAAALQPASPSAQTTQGPLVLEPLTNGFIVAPEARVTKINGSVETLV